MKHLIIATAILSLGASGAYAADLSQDEQLPEPPPVEQVAQPSSNYIALRLGGAFPKATEFNALGTTIENNYDKHKSWTGSAAIGTGFDNLGFPVRGELEVGYIKSPVENHVVGGVAETQADSFGDTKTLYGLANAYYDVRTGTAFTPFVGAGIGAGKVDLDNHGTTGAGTVMNDSGMGLAWQVGGGVNIDVAQNVGLELGYKYLNVENVGVNATDGTSNKVDVRNHMATAGIKFGF